jgi:putative ABC transport system ATP-binding protein
MPNEGTLNISISIQEVFMQPQQTITAQDIHRTILLGGRELHILRGISFTASAGEWVALTGPSGSGKSTLLGILAGIDQPSSGKVSVDGVEISEMSEDHLARIRNEKIGMVFQAFHLIPSMTAQENVEIPLYVSPKRREAQKLARQMLEQVGLSERLHHLPHQLSGGEQQRVAIARALVTRPRLLLADEPTGNLDSATSKQVLALIQQLRKQLNLTIIMVTHDSQVAAHADRTIHMIDGELVKNPIFSTVMA